jgi:hypothetical protein
MNHTAGVVFLIAPALFKLGVAVLLISAASVARAPLVDCWTDVSGHECQVAYRYAH